MFWIIAFLLTGLTTVLLCGVLLSRGASARGNANEVTLYKRQLRGIEDDLKRGVLSPSEADDAKVEISRRLLAADARKVTESGHGPAQPVVLVAATILVLAPALYLQLGTPGRGDMSLQTRKAQAEQTRLNRISQAAAERALPPTSREPDPEHVSLVLQLRQALQARPDDLQGHELLAASELRLGNFSAAHEVQNQVIGLKGETANAQDYARLADYLVLAAQGYVSPEAEDALDRALQLDETNGTARYYMGLMYAQTGRPDIAFGLWRDLLENGPQDAPWIPAIRAEIGIAADAAGVRYDMPEAPTDGMTREQFVGMVRGMVDGLSARLLSDGGSAEEWARLITSYGVLGELDSAKDTLDRARMAYEGDEAALSLIEDAAQQAGVTE